jgi:PTS system nitrogen regulatory IIA component
MNIEKLTQHMDPALWVGDLNAKTKDEALQRLTEALVASGRVKDRGVILEMLRNREALGSTAVGSGVAFPHGRSVAIPSLSILVARSKAGVDFDSMDGKPTHLFFLLMAPPQDTGNVYLQALGAITGLVQKDETRQKLLEAEDYEALLEVLKEAGQ